MIEEALKGPFKKVGFEELKRNAQVSWEAEQAAT